MVFSSVLFIFMFLPIAFGVYFSVPFRYKSLVILLFSYLFYGWWRMDYLALLFLVTLWSYIFGKLIYVERTAQSRKRLLVVAIAGPLLVLGYFKYCNFFMDSLADLFNGGAPFTSWHARILLPIGISFYIFQAISYLIDIYREDAPPAQNFFDFAAFKALFPQLVAGPVLRYKDLAHQFMYRQHSLELFAEGGIRFFAGLAKKVLIADSVAPIADAIFAKADPTLAEAWLGTIAYSIQLYFDFSGYSSMAVGLGMMMGFRFIENFDCPYVSRSITEFWRRWHLSLSAWLRDYLYIPLGGNRLGTFRTYFNLFITMVLGGLWHGANWTFVLWGVWHGGLLALERLLGIRPSDKRSVVALGGTLLLVMLGWVMFRSLDVHSALDMYRGMIGLNGLAMQPDIAWQIKNFALASLAVGVVVVFIEPWFNRTFPAERLIHMQLSPSTGGVALAATGIVCFLGMVSILKLTADNDSPFLYFQF